MTALDAKVVELHSVLLDVHVECNGAARLHYRYIVLPRRTFLHLDLLDAIFPPSFDGCHPNFSQAAFFVIGMEMEVDSTFDLGSEQKAQEARAFEFFDGLGPRQEEREELAVVVLMTMLVDCYLGHRLGGGFALMAESI
ncbi:hypothetical protein ACHAXS_005343 [Conticribra weissflogii]